MAEANQTHITNLSSMIRHPLVRAAFAAAERDGRAPLGVRHETPSALTGGEAAAPEREFEPA